MAQQQLFVEFCFHSYADDENDDTVTCLPEPTTADEIAAVHQALAKNKEHAGELIIRSEGDEVRLNDSLDALVVQLCFESLPDLIATKHVVVGHYLVYGYIRLDPEGDLTLLSGDFIEKVRVPRAALIAALFAAGERYIAVIKQLQQLDASYGDLLETLEDARAEAAPAMADSASGTHEQ